MSSLSNLKRLCLSPGASISLDRKHIRNLKVTEKPYPLHGSLKGTTTPSLVVTGADEGLSIELTFFEFPNRGGKLGGKYTLTVGEDDCEEGSLMIQTVAQDFITMRCHVHIENPPADRRPEDRKIELGTR